MGSQADMKVLLLLIAVAAAHAACPKTPANYCSCATDVNYKYLCKANNGYTWHTNDDKPVCPCPCKYSECTVPTTLSAKTANVYVHNLTDSNHCEDVTVDFTKDSPLDRVKDWWAANEYKYKDYPQGLCPKKFNHVDGHDSPIGVKGVTFRRMGIASDDVVSLADATPYCLFHEDTVDHKCMEACAAGKFATKGITNVGHCPTKYSTVDHTVTQEQCPDGVTNLRYCQSTKLNVTVTTKGEAGGFAAKATETNAVSLADATPYCLFHEDTVDHKCMEACAAGKFATKGITNVG